MINKEDIEKLKKHCEKQIQLSEIFNDLKTAREHETILALIEENKKVKFENEQLKIALKSKLRLDSALYGLDTGDKETASDCKKTPSLVLLEEFYKLRDRWSMFRTHIKKCLDDLEAVRYDISADEYIDKKHVLEGVLAKMDELEKLND